METWTPYRGFSSGHDKIIVWKSNMAMSILTTALLSLVLTAAHESPEPCSIPPGNALNKPLKEAPRASKRQNRKLGSRSTTITETSKIPKTMASIPKRKRERERERERETICGLHPETNRYLGNCLGHFRGPGKQSSEGAAHACALAARDGRATCGSMSRTLRLKTTPKPYMIWPLGPQS